MVKISSSKTDVKFELYFYLALVNAVFFVSNQRLPSSLFSSVVIFVSPCMHLLCMGLGLEVLKLSV